MAAYRAPVMTTFRAPKWLGTRQVNAQINRHNLNLYARPHQTDRTAIPGDDAAFKSNFGIGWHHEIVAL